MANPVKQEDSIYSILLPKEALALDPVAFDNFCNTYGVRFIHFRAAPCPIGLDDPTDIRRTHDDHSSCSNGFIYTAIGRVTGIFSSNSTSVMKLDPAFVDGSTVSVTFPRFYDSDPGHRFLLRPYDRLFLEEEGITVGGTNLQKRRQDGRADRLNFPAVAVHQLIDSSGNGYQQGLDFIIDRGDISWLPGKGPRAGQTYSIWYEYTPYWYVSRLIHEIRVVPVASFLNAKQIHNERLSFGAILQREYVHRDKTPDLLTPDIGGRQQQVPDLNIPPTPGIEPTFG